MKTYESDGLCIDLTSVEIKSRRVKVLSFDISHAFLYQIKNMILSTISVLKEKTKIIVLSFLENDEIIDTIVDFMRHNHHVVEFDAMFYSIHKSEDYRRYIYFDADRRLKISIRKTNG